MDCMEAKALKPSLRGELTQPTWFEECFGATAGFSVMPNEDFSIDELLDFSNEQELQDDDNDFGVLEEEEVEVEKDDNNSLDIDDNSSNSGSLSRAGDSATLPAGELTVPDDYLALEWLSQFVDDSSPSELSLLCPVVSNEEMKMKEQKNRSEPVSEPGLTRPLCLPSWGPAKARSKRPRSGNPVWSIGSPSSSSGSSSSGFILTNPVHITDFSSEPVMKKAKKKPTVQAVQFQRRCTHCGVQKTPQWRTGPLGPKTLCNACGVRFKSGRLFPEYRPACSPTFSSDMHSNSHRKVLEMRKRKELEGAIKSGLNRMPVQSF